MENSFSTHQSGTQAKVYLGKQVHIQRRMWVIFRVRSFGGKAKDTHSREKKFKGESRPSPEEEMALPWDTNTYKGTVTSVWTRDGARV